MTSKHQNKIKGPVVVAEWTSPEGECFVLMSGPGHSIMQGAVPPAPPVKKTPAWVKKPASFFKKARPDLILVVGKAEPSPMGIGPMLQFTAADAEARALDLVARARKKKKVTTSQAELGPMHQLAYWRSPAGQLHVLAAFEKAD